MAMDPADMRDALEATARGMDAAAPVAPVAPTRAPPSAAVPGDRAAILGGISASYFRLRRGLAALSFALPLVLWLGAAPRDLQGSISAYYHFAQATPTVYGAGTMRDFFVGILAIIAAFLFFYRGYSRPEDRALNLAGIAAGVVAVSPMNWPATAATTWRGELHHAAATVFFLAIAYVAVFRSGDTLDQLTPERRGAFRMTYRILGTLMVAVPAIVFAVHRLAHEPHSRALWLIEVAGIYTFSAFWLVKSREIALIERP